MESKRMETKRMEMRMDNPMVKQMEKQMVARFVLIHSLGLSSEKTLPLTGRRNVGRKGISSDH